MRTIHSHPSPSALCPAGASRLQVTCRQGLGGPSFGGRPGGSDQPGRLILPGSQQGPPGLNKRLVLPSQQGPGSGLGGRPGDAPPPQFGNFRPPPGFMDAVGRPEAEEPTMSKEEMLNRLRSSAGYWHQLAKLLPLLQRAGCDSVQVEEAVGLERRQQNVWMAAEQVYESVKRSGELSTLELEHFDMEGGEDLLFELRFLSIRQRTQAAMYIVDKELSPAEAQVLARSIKDHERRDGGKEGFSTEPGDCLAYKFYRDALECRRKEEAENFVRQGLEVAVTDRARAKLASMLSEQEKVEAARPTATLTMLRMTKDELGFRIVCVAGSLQECSAGLLSSAPKASSEGIFGNFRVPQGDHQWVALPSWSMLQLAGHPVALSIANCADVPEIRATSFAKTDEDLKRLAGSGLLLVDLAPEFSSINPDSFYIVDAGGRVQLQEGITVSGPVLGQVLFLCRPPTRDGGMAGSTAELLSL